ncbi:hypothetical protein ASE48_08675 [Mycobacterium sp. Root265]|uniref:hypothetical protein n=1 Tax=Mycobacterium sp. Root265 TaxID=1736504 RepID=UPI00070FFF47|nr:hypothetical protein [Mycobacterium sp. Root265]KRD08625.1 hypothetical protein ASE48_08675 [Mycobacterium sp. Root265]
MSTETETISASADVLKRGIEIVLDENAKLLAKNRDLVSHQVSQAQLILDLQGRLSTATRVFGEAFVYGDTRRGPKRPNRPKLSDQEAKDIKAAFQGGMKQVDLARNYGVNPSTISRTVRGFYN